MASLWPALGTEFTKGDSAAEPREPSADVAPSRAVALAGVAAADAATTGHLTSAAPTADVAAAPSIPLRRLQTTWSPPTFSASTGDLSHLPVGHQSLEPPEFSWVNETLRHIGTVVHARLEALASASTLPTIERIEVDRETYRQQLRRHGVPERELTVATDSVVRALTNTISDERGRWIFAPEHQEARSELALTGIAGGRLTQIVIDRSFVDRDGIRWVIDFKTSRHEGGGLAKFLEDQVERYRSQLETYITLARALGPQPVRAGLYFPLIGAFRELG